MGNKGGKQQQPPVADDAVGVQNKRDPTGNPSEQRAGTPVKSKTAPENVQSSNDVSSSIQNQGEEIRANQEKEMKLKQEEERKRKEAEELAKEQELARIAAEEAERKRKEAEELARKEEMARVAEEEERKREEERKLAEEEEEKRKLEEAERARIRAAEEEAKRKEAQELARKQAEEEAKRKREEEERARIRAEEEAAQKLAEEEEAKRKEAEELAKKQAEEAKRKKEEEERARIRAEEEEEAAQKLAEEEEAKRKEAEELAKKQAEAEAIRKQAEEAERIRKAEAQAREAQEQARLAMLHAEEAKKSSQLAAQSKKDSCDDTGGDQMEDNPSDLVGGDHMNLPDEPYMKENSDTDPTIEVKETTLKVSEDTGESLDKEVDTDKKEMEPLKKMDSIEAPRHSIIVVTPPAGDTSAVQKIGINLDEEPSEKPAAGDVAWDTYMQRRDPGVSPRIISRRKSATREAPPAPIEPPPTLKEDESNISNRSADDMAWDAFMQNRASASPRQSVGRRKSQMMGIPPGAALLEESTASPALNPDDTWDALMRNRSPSSPRILSKRKSNRRRSSSGSKSKEIRDPTLKFRQLIARRGPISIQSPTADPDAIMQSPDALTSTDLMTKTGSSDQDVAWEAFMNNRGSGTSPRVQSKRKSALQLQQNGGLL